MTEDLISNLKFSNIQELNAAAEPPVCDSSIDISKYFTSASKILEKVREYDAEGEVELKYIYLMRYITLIIAMIPKHKQYPTVSNRLKDHFRNQAKKCLEDTEKLKEQLKNAYEYKKVQNLQININDTPNNDNKDNNNKSSSFQAPPSSFSFSNLKQMQNEPSQPSFDFNSNVPPSSSEPFRMKGLMQEQAYQQKLYEQQFGNSPSISSKQNSVSSLPITPPSVSVSTNVNVNKTNTTRSSSVSSIPKTAIQRSSSSPIQKIPEFLQPSNLNSSKETNEQVQGFEEDAHALLHRESNNEDIPQSDFSMAPFMALPPGFSPNIYMPQPMIMIPPGQMFPPPFQGPIPTIAPMPQPQMQPSSSPQEKTNSSNSSSSSNVSTSSKPSNSTAPEVPRINGLRPVVIDRGLIEQFIQKALFNTKRNIETCGILAGTLKKGCFYISHLLIPKQKGSSDRCEMLNEDEVFIYMDENELMTLGWIHTHPSHDMFLSSVDIHTHFSYQCLLKEAIAIVVAPRFSPPYSSFSLTDPYGLSTIQACKQRGFHPHPKGMYKSSSHVQYKIGTSYFLKDLR